MTNHETGHTQEQLENQRDRDALIRAVQAAEQDDWEDDIGARIELNSKLEAAGYEVEFELDPENSQNIYTIVVEDEDNPGELREISGFLWHPGLDDDGSVFATFVHGETPEDTKLVDLEKVDQQVVQRNLTLDTDQAEQRPASNTEVEEDTKEAQEPSGTQRGTRNRGENAPSTKKHSRKRAGGENHEHGDKKAAAKKPEVGKLKKSASTEQTKEPTESKNQIWARKELGNLNMLEVSNELSDAREKLAEARVKARRSGVFASQKRRAKKLEQADQAYRQRRVAIEKQLLDGYVTKSEYSEIKAAVHERYESYDNTDAEYSVKETMNQYKVVKSAQKRALIAQLSAKEDGALMGEEAQYYLTKEDSWSARMMDRYKSAGKWKRRMINIGGVAVVGTGAGLVGGLAAAGAVVGARVGKGYANREASRSNSGSDNLSREQLRAEREFNSTLDQSNYQDYVEMYKLVRDLKSRDGDGKFTAVSTKDMHEAAEAKRIEIAETASERYSVALDEAETESQAKRKSAAWAVGGAAVGATAGALLDNFIDSGAFEGRADWVKDKLGFADDSDYTGSKPNLSGNESLSDAQAELEAAEEQAENAQQRLNAAEERSQELDQLEAEQDAQSSGSGSESTTDQPAQPEATAPTTAAEAAFGELAGEQLDVTIEEGSTLSHEVYDYVNSQELNLNADQKKELVYNIVNKMREQYPGRDLDLVYPNESFTATLN